MRRGLSASGRPEGSSEAVGRAPVASPPLDRHRRRPRGADTSSPRLPHPMRSLRLRPPRTSALHVPVAVEGTVPAELDGVAREGEGSGAAQG